MRLQESGEMYLESIFVLSKKLNGVRSIDISEYMGYSKPSVSRAVSLLKNGGYIRMDEENYITLTDMLIHLGVPADIASQDACKMEHAISDESLEAIKKHMAR